MTQPETPTKTAERQSGEKRMLVEQLEKTPVVQIACEKTGVGRSTYYRWLKEDSEFSKNSAAALGRWVQLMNDMAESQLLNAVRDGNMTGIIFWLKSRHKAYCQPSFHEYPIQKEDDNELTAEQRASIDRILAEMRNRTDMIRRQ